MTRDFIEIGIVKKATDWGSSGDRDVVELPGWWVRLRPRGQSAIDSYESAKGMEAQNEARTTEGGSGEVS